MNALRLKEAAETGRNKISLGPGHSRRKALLRHEAGAENHVYEPHPLQLCFWKPQTLIPGNRQTLNSQQQKLC